jgi:hypothetical protein
MSEQPAYPSMQRMLNQLNQPFHNVGRWMDINAIGMMLLVPVFLQTERLAALNPSGYAPLPLVLAFAALLLLVIIVEAFIAVAIFSGIGWIMNVPGFFAIGVIRGMQGAEQRYRDVHTRFYRRLHGRILFSGLVLVANSIILFLLLIGWLLTSTSSYAIISVILFVLSVTSAHLLIGLVATNKQEKWKQIPDVQIRNDAERLHRRLPGLASIPSVDEMEEILRKAEHGDENAQSNAHLLNRVAGREYFKNIIWMLFMFLCIVLILL